MFFCPQVTNEKLLLSRFVNLDRTSERSLCRDGKRVRAVFLHSLKEGSQTVDE